MLKYGLVPVFYHADAETAGKAVKACYDGGVRVFEFTNRGDFAHEVFGKLNKWRASECPDLILGVGSVVDAPTAALYMQLGADFVVGPLFNPDVAAICNRRCVPYIPGCATPGEISAAQEAGAQIVKVFPANTVGGPEFVKSVKAPMPWSRIMATGGVEPVRGNLEKWFAAGVDCVGMGSCLFPSDAIKNERWDEITALCRDVLDWITEFKTR